MKHFHWLFDVLLICSCLVFLPGLQCQTNPVSPTPAVVGGSASTGGAPATGGTSTGSVSATGGTTTETTATVAAVRFPLCNSASQAAKAFDPLKLKLGRKQGPIVKSRKASYEVDNSARSVFWASRVPWAINQADLGACTGFATVQTRLNAPFILSTIPGTPVTIPEFEQLGRDIYSGATKRDRWDGVWPPTDTGSSGSAALDEALVRGLFNGYSTVSSLAEMQRALQSGPLLFGVDWYDGMFAPSRCGEIKATGKLRGGHEIAIVGLDVDTKTVWGLTSWGNEFGVCLDAHCGYFYMTYGMVSNLFAAGGEAEQPANGNATLQATGF